MQSSDPGPGRIQSLTNQYFAEHASEWADIYHSQGVKEIIHQERLERVLALVRSLSLPQGTAALEVGCGAGFAATTLAESGFRVEAIDPVEEMVDATRARAQRRGLQERLRADLGDVYSLPFDPSTFELVIAMGVLPWLPSIETPVREMSRVLAPGGHLIVTTDNLWSLRWWMEPLNNPLMRPAKELAQRVRRKLGREPSCAPWYPTSKRALDRVLRDAGLQKTMAFTIGFGPLTCLNRELLPRRWGAALHSSLQRLADRGSPAIRSLGCHYLVMARKVGEGSEPGVSS